MWDACVILSIDTERRVGVITYFLSHNDTSLLPCFVIFLV